jgi:phage tail tape-measure protein
MADMDSLETRLQTALEAFRRQHPDITIEQYQVDGLREAAQDFEKGHPGTKLTPEQIETVLARDLQEQNISAEKISDNIGAVVTGGAYGFDGIGNAEVGISAMRGAFLKGGALPIAGRLAGPVIGLGLGAYDTYEAVQKGDCVGAGEAAGGALGSIGLAVATGAAVGSIVPVGGTIVGGVAGFIAGVGGYFLGRWAGGEVTKQFCSAASPEPQKEQPVAQLDPQAQPQKKPVLAPG